jgi:hypothetical protein
MYTEIPADFTLVRFRYRISTVIKWKKRLLKFNKGVYIPLNVEFFFNFKKAGQEKWNHVVMNDGMSAKDEKKHKTMSKIGLLLLLIGFILQGISALISYH